jgi:hypothetical protein
MTTLSNNNITQNDELQELLTKNLPSCMKAGNEKEFSNVRTYPARLALEECKFVNFNSNVRISMMIFDIDKVGDKTAQEHFPFIKDILAFIMEKVGLEPTYILYTQKGYHFAYHLKNHVYLDQPKAVEYLRNIKIAITALLGCDPNASHRLNGVWRNPLMHDFRYSEKYNYELFDFKKFLPKREFSRQQSRKQKINVDITLLEEGNRNNTLFVYAMKFAKGHTALTTEQIVDFLEGVNSQCPMPLEINELHSIASSVFRYWTQGTIRVGTLTQREPIQNEGIMEFPKMAGLSLKEYEAEVKRRQKLSAQRTNKIKNKEKASQQLAKARECSAKKRQIENEQKVLGAIERLKDEGEKITISAISRIAGIDRRTVGKYYFLHLD